MTRHEKGNISGRQKTMPGSPWGDTAPPRTLADRQAFLTALGALAVLVLAQMSLGPKPAEACTTILVGKTLTEDGSVLHAHNEDMGNEAVGRLWFQPAMEYRPGELFSVPYVELERSGQSAGYWASGNAEGGEGLGVATTSRPYDSVLVGLNQHGVSMSCNWAHSRAENLEGAGIRRYALRQLLLERATSAKHGVEILGQLIESHGQADWGGLIYHLADPTEAWVVETTTHNWVARRVRDDEIRVTANRFRIGSDYDLSSASLELEARNNGWLEEGADRVDFAQVFGLPQRMNEAYDSRREARVDELLTPDRGRLTPSHLLAVLRDRYQGTPHFTPPQVEPVWRENLAHRPDVPRTIDTNLAQSTSVAHHRSGLPAEVGSVLWYGMGTPSWAGYVPLYALGGKIPEAYSLQASQQDTSAWGLFRRLQRQADRDYDNTWPIARVVWDDQLVDTRRRQAVIEAEVLALLQSGSGAAAREALSYFTAKEAGRVLELAEGLLERFAPPPSETQDASEAGDHDL